MLGRGERPGNSSAYRGGGERANRSEYDGGISELVQYVVLPPF